MIPEALRGPTPPSKYTVTESPSGTLSMYIGDGTTVHRRIVPGETAQDAARAMLEMLVYLPNTEVSAAAMKCPDCGFEQVVYEPRGGGCATWSCGCPRKMRDEREIERLSEELDETRYLLAGARQALEMERAAHSITHVGWALDRIVWSLNSALTFAIPLLPAVKL